MKRKAIVVLIFLLGVLTIVQLVRNFSLPDVPVDLLANEETCYQIVNEGKLSNIFFVCDRILKIPSNYKNTLKVKDSLKRSVTLLKKTIDQLDRALAIEPERDSTDIFLKHAIHYQNEMLRLRYGVTSQKLSEIIDVDNILLLPQPLVSLAIEKAKFDILSINEQIINGYSSQVEDWYSLKGIVH